MITLLLDSSNIDLTVGLSDNSTLVDYISYPAWQMQSEYMILEINKILERNNITPNDINEIISSKGPGSYTGVRISLTIAKTWGTAGKIDAFLVSSLTTKAFKSSGINSTVSGL